MQSLGSASEEVKQTIIIVHGSFSSPIANEQLWWHSVAADSFSARLQRALQNYQADVECWAHSSDANPVFSWSGRNDWVDRAEASSALAMYIAKLDQLGWQCHLVGHSHGGNVIVEALHALRGTPAHLAVRSIVTLGTPFLNTLSVVERHKRKQRLLSGIFMAIGAFFLVVTLALLLNASNTFGLGEGLLLGGTVALISMGAWGFVDQLLRERGRSRRAKGIPLIPALALNSPYDEAWQLLHHVRNTANPIAVQGGLLSYLLGQMRSTVQRRVAVNRALSFAPLHGELPIWRQRVLTSLHLVTIAALITPSIWHGLSLQNALIGLLWGVLSFIGLAILIFVLGLGAWRATFVYSRPVVALTLWIASIGVVPSECVTYLVRAKSWRLLQQWALGLEGFKFEMPQVQLVPLEAGPALFAHENISDVAKDRALLTRAKWLELSIGSAAEMLSQLVLSAADIRKLVEQIERDPSLVHAAYYCDDECIDRIAHWISSRSSMPT